MNIKEFREKYPQYNSVSDEDLTKKLHQKFYKDKLSLDDFRKRFGYSSEKSLTKKLGIKAIEPEDLMDAIASGATLGLSKYAKGAGRRLAELTTGINYEEMKRLQETVSGKPKEKIGPIKKTIGEIIGAAVPIGMVGRAIATPIEAALKAGKFARFARPAGWAVAGPAYTAAEEIAHGELPSLKSLLASATLWGGMEAVAPIIAKGLGKLYRPLEKLLKEQPISAKEITTKDLPYQKNIAEILEKPKTETPLTEIPEINLPMARWLERRAETMPKARKIAPKMKVPEKQVSKVIKPKKPALKGKIEEAVPKGLESITQKAKEYKNIKEFDRWWNKLSIKQRDNAYKAWRKIFPKETDENLFSSTNVWAWAHGYKKRFYEKGNKIIREITPNTIKNLEDKILLTKYMDFIHKKYPNIRWDLSVGKQAIQIPSRISVPKELPPDLWLPYDKTIMPEIKKLINIHGSKEVSSGYDIFHEFFHKLNPKGSEKEADQFALKMLKSFWKEKPIEKISVIRFTKPVEIISTQGTKIKLSTTEDYRIIPTARPNIVKLTDGKSINVKFDSLQKYDKYFETVTPKAGGMIPEHQRPIYAEKIKTALKTQEENWRQAKEVGKQFQSKVDVQAPFNKIGAEETGFHIKNYPSIRTMYEEKTMDVTKSIAKTLKNDPDKMARIVLEAQSKTPPVEPDMKEAWQSITKYYKESFAEYKKLGGLETPFPESMINRIKARNEYIDEMLTGRPKMPKAQKEKLLEEINHNKESIKVLEKTQFQHIPTAIWFETFQNRSTPEEFAKVMRIYGQIKRKTGRIEDLIESGAIKMEDLNIVDVLGHYGRRLGRDVGLLKIINAAKNDKIYFEGALKNLVIKGKPKGYENYVEIPPWKAPALSGYNLHPAFADYVAKFIETSERPLIGKAVGAFKMLQFDNPLFLPGYDIPQGFMLGSIRSPKLPKYMVQAAKDMYKKTPEYWQAIEEGLISKPYNNPFDSWQKSLERIKTHGEWTIPNITKTIGKNLIHPIDTFYRYSWNTAWYLDHYIRQTSYRYLLDKGYSPRAAGQTAALFHGDYAKIPANTRRILNKIFFTPTFKMAMGHLLSDMIKSVPHAVPGMTKIAEKVGVPKAVIAGVPAKQTARKMATGLAASFAVIEGFDLFMRSHGWKCDQWGRRYYKRIDDVEKGPQDVVFTWSMPANVFLKYPYRFAEAIKPGIDNPIIRFVESNRWELHPFYRVALELGANRKPNNTTVWDFDDGLAMKVGKGIKYATENLVRVLGRLDYTDMEKEARKKLIKETSLVFETATRPFTFSYLRRPKELQLVSELNRLREDFNRELLNKEDNNQLTEKKIESMIKALDKKSMGIVKRIDELQKEEEQEGIILMKSVAEEEYSISKQGLPEIKDKISQYMPQTEPSQTISINRKQTKLTDEQFRRFKDESNNLIEQRLIKAMTNPTWDKISQSAKQRLAKKIIKTSRERIRTKLQKELGHIPQKAGALKKKRERMKRLGF